MKKMAICDGFDMFVVVIVDSVFFLLSFQPEPSDTHQRKEEVNRGIVEHRQTVWGEGEWGDEWGDGSHKRAARVFDDEKTIVNLPRRHRRAATLKRRKSHFWAQNDKKNFAISRQQRAEIIAQQLTMTTILLSSHTH